MASVFLNVDTKVGLLLAAVILLLVWAIVDPGGLSGTVDAGADAVTNAIGGG